MREQEKESEKITRNKKIQSRGMTAYALKKEKKDILTSFKRPKWPISPNKRLNLRSCLFFENNKSK